MTLSEMIYQHSLRLYEPAAREVLDFIEFLEQRQLVKTGQPFQSKRQAGSAKGELKIIDEDDERLADFKEYLS